MVKKWCFANAASNGIILNALNMPSQKIATYASIVKCFTNSKRKLLIKSKAIELKWM